MDTINLIEKWLFVFTSKILYFYLIIWLWQRLRISVISVKGVRRLNILYDFTYYILLPLMSALGFFQLTEWGSSDMLAIAVNMMFVMFWMIEIRNVAKWSYLRVKGELVDLVVVAKSDKEATYILQTLDGSIFWQETTKEIPLLKLFNSAEENCYLVKIRDVVLKEENPFVIEFLTEDDVKDEVERIKKQRGSE